MIIEVLCVLGFILSLYAIYVKTHADNPGYTAMCDISENVSCSKAFSSGEGSLFVLPNSYFGVVFYSLVFVMAWFEHFGIVTYLSLFAVFVSVYLASVLVRQRNYCVVCMSVYVINVLIFVFSFV